MLVEVLGCIRWFSTKMNMIGYGLTTATRFARLLCEIMISFLSKAALPLPSSIEVELSLILIEVTHFCRKPLCVRRSFVKHMLPGILSVHMNRDHFGRLGVDTQV